MKLAAWPRAFASRSSAAVERADPLEQLELVAEMRAHHLRAVGGDRERDAVVDEGAERRADRSSSASAFVSRFEVGQISSTIPASRSSAISAGSLAARMPWPIRSGRRLSTTSPISSAPVAPSSPTWIVTPSPAARAVSTIGAHRRVVVARPARARPGDVDPDDAAARPGDRLVDDDRVLPLVERAIHHQDQPGAHLRVLEPGAVETADRGEDDVVEVALAAPVALHRVEAELERRDPLRAVGAADRAVHRPLDREWGGLDQLRPVVDRVERVEVLDAARVGDGDEPVELPVVLHRQRDPLLVREAPEDVGGDRAAEVGVELGEAFVGGDHVPHSTQSRAREPQSGAPAVQALDGDVRQLHLRRVRASLWHPGDRCRITRRRLARPARHIRSSPDLVQAYDEVKLAAAPQGKTAYWEAKNAFLQGLLTEIR